MRQKLQKHPEDKIYEEWGVEPPSHESHATEEEIKEALSKPVVHHWKQKGAVLICDACPWEHATEPRFKDYILTGTDEKGLPILQKVVLTKVKLSP